MPEQKTLFVFSPPSSAGACFQRYAGKVRSLSWIYLGDDHLEQRAIAAGPGEGFSCRNSLSGLFHTARVIAPEYVRWTDRLNAANGKSPMWWFTPLSSRNQEHTGIFRRFCQLESFRHLLGGAHDAVCLVFVSSSAFSKILVRLAEKEGYSCRVAAGWKWPWSSVGKSIHFCARWIVAVVAGLLKVVSARILFPRHSSDKKFDVFLATVAHESSFSDDGTFHDRHLPGLLEFFSAREQKAAVFLHIYHFGMRYWRILRRLAKSRMDFFLPEKHVGVGDLVWAWGFPLWMLSGKFVVEEFSGVDVRSLVREEILSSPLNAGIYAAMLYRWTARFARNGFTAPRAILWYENRVEDKALVLGLRRAFPQMTIAGAQIFLYFPFGLSLFPTENEKAAGVLPDVFWEPSERQGLLARRFAPGVLCRTVPALRYGHLYDKYAVPAESCGETQEILVALSFKATMSVEMMDVVAEAFRQVPGPFRLVLRPHPDLRMDKVLAASRKTAWPDFEIDKRPLSEALSRASMFVASTSGVVVEAAVRGIPIVFIHGASILDSNPLGMEHASGVAECYNVADVVSAIDRFSALSAGDRARLREEGFRLRDKFFTPVDEKGMDVFLDDQRG